MYFQFLDTFELVSSLSYLFYILSCILSYIDIIPHSILKAFNSSSSSPSIVHPTDFSPQIAFVPSLSNAYHFLSIKITNINDLYWKSQLFHILERSRTSGFFCGSNPCPPVNNITTPNLALLPWILRDQLLMSPLISSLSNKSDDTIPFLFLSLPHEI